MSQSRAIIVGAGIVGAACAWALAREGFVVTVVDPRPIGSGATAAGMGHLVIIDEPQAEFALTKYSMQLWHALAPSMGASVEYAQCGTLWVATDEEEMAEASAKLTRLNSAGLEANLIPGERVRELEPNLRKGLCGGLLVPGDGLVYPPRAAAWLLNDAKARIIASLPVTSLSAGKISLADGSDLFAEVIVVAAGLDTRSLVPDLPLRARKGHLIITDRYPGFCSHQIVELGYIKNAHANSLESVAFNLQPRPNGQLLLGSSRQFDIEQPDVESRMLSKVIDRASAFMPSIGALSGIRAWTGLRAATPDGMPLIGAMPRMPGVFIAAGHEGLGITTSLGTAAMIASLIAGRTPELDPTPYRPGRFQEGAAP